MRLVEHPGPVRQYRVGGVERPQPVRRVVQALQPVAVASAVGEATPLLRHEHGALVATGSLCEVGHVG